MKTVRDIYYSLRARVARADRNAAFTASRPDPVRALARNSVWSSQRSLPIRVDATGNLPWADYPTR